MASSDDLRMLMRYGAWAGARQFEYLAGVPAEVVQAPRPGRPAGLLGWLAHVYVVDLIWKGHLEGREHGFKTRHLAAPMPLPALGAAQAAVDQWYIRYADELSEESLAQVVSFRFVDGGAGALRRGDMLLHIANHRTYHRGYVADMLYESGLQPPTIDLPVYLRDVAPR